MQVLYDMLNLAFIHPSIYQAFLRGNFTAILTYSNNLHRDKVVKEIEVITMLRMVQ